MAAPSISTTSDQSQAKTQAILNGPAGRPPVGVVPNFHDPPNLDTAVTTIVAVCLFTSTLAVLIRMYTKSFLIRSIAYEDCKSFYLTLLHCIYTENIRRDRDSVGKILSKHSDAFTAFPLTKTGRPDCLCCIIGVLFQSWWWSPYLGSTGEELY